MKYRLGMDGGGTATKISAADRDGHVIARHTAGPLNVNGQSPEQFQATLGEILRWLNASGFQAGNCGGIGIGAAGISNPPGDIRRQFLRIQTVKPPWPPHFRNATALS